MPRKPRMYLPGIPCHVIQRGNNRDATFFTGDDYRFYIECLREGSERYGVAVHAYVLMTNHVHLLMTPERADSVSRLMQSIGRRYVQYVNRTYRRTGTLWESRHKASLVQRERYLLACYRYIELNPVRAGMVEHPAEYPWSSFAANAQRGGTRLIQPHGEYLALGETPEARRAAYRELFRNELDGPDVAAIRNAARFSMPMGDRGFQRQIESRLNRSLGHAGRGRPRMGRE